MPIPLFTDKLDGPFNIKEVEERNMEKCNGKEGRTLPFGNINFLWEVFKRQYCEGDELYSFISSPMSWENRCGRAGFLIMREGKVVDSLITMLN